MSQLRRILPHLRVPVVSAPMAYTSGWKLACAVSQAGGLGFIGAGYVTDPNWAAQELQQAEAALTRTANGRLPVGIGFITWHLLAAPAASGEASVSAWQHILAVALDYRPAALWLSFGDAQPVIAWLRERERALASSPSDRCPVFVQVSSVAEAREAVAWGADVIAAQGVEAGGHGAAVGSSTLCLVPETVDAVAQHGTPVLAAGGVTDGRGLAAIMSLGAAGAVMGTRFLACHESLASESIKDTIVAAKDGGLSTVRTTVFDRMRSFDWPKQYDARALRNRTTAADEAVQAGTDPTARLPTQEEYVAAGRGHGDASIALASAGQAVGLVRERQSAAQIVEQTMAEARLAWQQSRAVFGEEDA
ncbi:2-nitropropane dioxygenase [Thamnocephalis sphaerospora]|uniref:2-nitropropane dioxygenase n=1 Tax=Thamnocephalis sphaerospora TaxID=78915 RepID=A0A4V1IWT7_9FUNG|nr:2-nitropropane dioxygenase [Thamnocephalis sphaerospora]|eukprot:RKP08699.1 2-nitropropane dioxygenase [Thamnocephalis sphaerospora]